MASLRRHLDSWWEDPWTYPWSLLKEPRALSAIMTAFYLTIVLLVGIPTLLVLPGTGMAIHFDASLSIITGGSLTVGGLIAAASLWGGAWAIERGGIYILAGGLIARGVIVVALPYTDAVTSIGLGEVTALLLALAARFFTIRGLDLNPREAG